MRRRWNTRRAWGGPRRAVRDTWTTASRSIEKERQIDASWRRSVAKQAEEKVERFVDDRVGRPAIRGQKELCEIYAWLFSQCFVGGMAALAIRTRSPDRGRRSERRPMARLGRKVKTERLDEASSQFKEAIRLGWENRLKTARAPVGGSSLQGQSLDFQPREAGDTDGEYVITNTRPGLTKKASAVETVTPERDKSGTWRVSGYYIK